MAQMAQSEARSVTGWHCGLQDLQYSKLRLAPHALLLAIFFSKMQMLHNHSFAQSR